MIIRLFLCCSDFLKRRIKIRRADSDIITITSTSLNEIGETFVLP